MKERRKALVGHNLIEYVQNIKYTVSVYRYDKVTPILEERFSYEPGFHFSDWMERIVRKLDDRNDWDYVVLRRINTNE